MNWACQREPNKKASPLKEVDDLKRPNTSPPNLLSAPKDAHRKKKVDEARQYPCGRP
ncbi:hypothetical protein GBA52_020199 [Prunus armeniaca]|nr:hypothetical protein GBA52_020199 [Prunus armeniaca]